MIEVIAAVCIAILYAIGLCVIATVLAYSTAKAARYGWMQAESMFWKEELSEIQHSKEGNNNGVNEG